MNIRLTAIITREGDGFFARYPELDVASHIGTADEAIKICREVNVK